MKTLAGCLLLSVLLLDLCVPPAVAQAEQAAEARKVITKVAPVYPPLARTLRLVGAVKFEVLVTTSGAVKSLHVRGGNPVLVEAAENAVRGWRWEKSDHDSTELVEIKFAPF